MALRGRVSWIITVFVITILPLVTACTIKHTSEVNPVINNPPAVEVIPVTIGIYYPPEFVRYESRVDTWPHIWFVPVGKGSVALFDKVLPLMFKNVVNLTNWPDSGQNIQKISGVLIPTIEAIAFNFNGWRYTAEITYHIQFFSANGQPVASWKVNGTGVRKVGFDYFGHATPLGQVTEFAMQDAATFFMIRFGEDAAVKKWLNAIGR